MNNEDHQKAKLSISNARMKDALAKVNQKPTRRRAVYSTCFIKDELKTKKNKSEEKL